MIRTIAYLVLSIAAGLYGTANACLAAIAAAQGASDAARFAVLLTIGSFVAAGVFALAAEKVEP